MRGVGGAPGDVGTPLTPLCQEEIQLSEEDPKNWPPRIRCSDACDPSTLDTNNTVLGDTGCCGAMVGRPGSLRGPGGGGEISMGVLWRMYPGVPEVLGVPRGPRDAEGCARGSQGCRGYPGVPGGPRDAEGCAQGSPAHAPLPAALPAAHPPRAAALPGPVGLRHLHRPPPAPAGDHAGPAAGPRPGEGLGGPGGCGVAAPVGACSSRSRGGGCPSATASAPP